MKFARDDVAKIAASSMNNYLMFEKILKCKIFFIFDLRENLKTLIFVFF